MLTVAHVAPRQRIRVAPGDRYADLVARTTRFVPFSERGKRQDLYFPADQLIGSYFGKSPKVGEIALAQVKSTGPLGAFVQIEGLNQEIFMPSPDLKLKKGDVIRVKIVRGGGKPRVKVVDFFKHVVTAELRTVPADNHHETTCFDVISFPMSIVTGANWRHVPSSLLTESTRQHLAAVGRAGIVVLFDCPVISLVDLRFLRRFGSDLSGYKEMVGDFCQFKFLKIAPEIIKAITIGRVFTAEKAFDDFILQPREGLRCNTHRCLPIVGQGYLAEGVDWIPNGLLYVPEGQEANVRAKIDSGTFQFRLTIEGFSPSWTVWDLILAMHDRQLFVVPANDSMPAPKVAVLKERLNTGAWVATTEDGEMLYFSDRVSTKGSGYKPGEAVAVIETGNETFYRSEGEYLKACCSVDFFPVAELLLATLRAKKRFVASDFRGTDYLDNVGREEGEGKIPYVFSTAQELAASCRDYCLSGVGLAPGEKWEENPPLKDQVIRGGYRFYFEMEGLTDSWTAWDLIKALAKKPLLVVPIE